MQVRCPDCGNGFAPESGYRGGMLTCPACFNEFTPAANGPSPWLEPEVRRANGELLGALDRYRVRQMIYDGQLKGTEEVRIPGESWQPIAARPEFAEVLRMLGVDLGAQRISQQQLKGWRKTGSAIMPTRGKLVSEEREIQRQVQVREAEEREQTGQQAKVAIIGLVVVAVVVVLGLVFAG